MEPISLILLIILLSYVLSVIIKNKEPCNKESKNNRIKSNIIRYEESTDKESEISRTKYDEYLYAVKYVEQLSKVKGFASEILSGEWCDKSTWNDYSLDLSPWDKFAYSMLNKPELVKFNFDKCPICGKDRIRIYHQGEENDIVGKYILICRNCKKYFDYKTSSGLKSNDTKSLQEADCISEKFASNVEFTDCNNIDSLKHGDIRALCRSNYDLATDAEVPTIEIGKIYNVEYAIVGRSWSTVCFSEIPEQLFNSILFTYYIGGDEINMIADYHTIRRISNDMSRNTTTIMICKKLSDARIAQIRQRHNSIKRIIFRSDFLI